MRMVTNQETLADSAYQGKWPTETSMWCIQFQGKKYFPSDTVRKRYSNKLSYTIYSLFMVTTSLIVEISINALFPSLNRIK